MHHKTNVTFINTHAKGNSSHHNIGFFVDKIRKNRHEFRADYRQLGLLKTNFPNITVAAFTATATHQSTKHLHLLKFYQRLALVMDEKNQNQKKHTKANRCNDFNQKTALPIR
jgi:hypothetical protein